MGLSVPKVSESWTSAVNNIKLRAQEKEEEEEEGGGGGGGGEK